MLASAYIRLARRSVQARNDREATRQSFLVILTIVVDDVQHRHETPSTTGYVGQEREEADPEDGSKGHGVNRTRFTMDRQRRRKHAGTKQLSKRVQWLTAGHVFS